MKFPVFSNRIFKVLLKGLIWVLGVILSLILISSLLVYIFQDNIEQALISRINKNLKAQVEVKDIHFTVWRNFPNVSSVFENVNAKDSALGGKPLLALDEVVLEFNIWNIISGNYSIKNISLHDGEVNLVKFKNGEDNFHVWKSNVPDDNSDNGSVEIDLKKIRLKNVQFRYLDYKENQYFSFFFSKSRWKGRFGDDQYNLVGDGLLRADSLLLGGINYFDHQSISFDISGIVNNSNSTIDLNESKLGLDDIELFCNGKIVYDSLHSQLSLKGGFSEVKLERIIPLLPKDQKSFFEELEIEGLADLNFKIEGNFSSKGKLSLFTDYSIKSGRFLHKKNSIALDDLQLNGKINCSDLKTPSTIEIVVKNASAKMKGKTIQVSGSLVNLKQPKIHLNAGGSLNLSDWHKWINTSSIKSLSGELRFAIQYDVSLPGWASLKAADFAGGKSSGELFLSNGAVSATWLNLPMRMISLESTFENNSLKVKTLRFDYGKSDVNLSGIFDNFIPFLLLPNEKIRMEANLTSNRMVLDEVFALERKGFNSTKSGDNDIFIDEISAQLDLDVKEVVFGKFDARNCKASVYYANGRLAADNVSLKTLGGSISGKAILSESGDSLLLQTSAEFRNLDIRESFISFDNFGQESMTQENLRGRTSADIQLFAKMSRDFKISLKGIQSSIDLKVVDGEIMNYEPLTGMNEFIKGRDFSKVSFETLQNKISMSDGRINIPQMEIKSNALNLKVSGWHSFDNEIEYHIQVKMKELRRKEEKKGPEDEYGFVDNSNQGGGILFLLVTGTVDKPNYKQIDKEAMKEKITSDVKKEKENMKTILNKEFGLFKKDTSLIKDKTDPNQNKKIKVEWEDE